MTDKYKKKWKEYVSESNDRLLAESRVDDAVGKFPAVKPYLEIFTSNDPSGNNKYLMWLSKSLADKITGSENTEENTRVAKELQLLVQDYHKLLPYFKNRNHPEYHKFVDINPHTPEELSQAVLEVKQLAQTAQREKDKLKARKKRDSLKAKSESWEIEETDDYKIVRPSTEFASCYYGKGSTWCISATQSQNYFDSYTGEGQMFYFVFFSGAPKGEKHHKSSKYAIVLDRDSLHSGNEADWYDNDDNLMSQQDVRRQLINMWLESGYNSPAVQNYVERGYAPEEAVGELFEEIVQYSLEHASANPAGPNSAAFEEELNKYDGKLGPFVISIQDVDYDQHLWYDGYANINVQDYLDRYLREKKTLVKLVPGWDNYKTGIDTAIAEAVSDWIRANTRIEDYVDIEWDVDSEQEDAEFNFRLSFHHQNMNPNSLDEFQDMLHYFSEGADALDKYWYELVEDFLMDEDYYVHGEPLVTIDKRMEKYFPDPNYIDKQLSLPGVEEQKQYDKWKRTFGGV